VAIVKIDSPNVKVNSLSREMFPEFTSVMDEVSKNENVKAVVLISGKTSSFIAGAGNIYLSLDCIYIVD
jgi:enoyl-CoA hydratase/long-chain 3-hydroxyacyl-CoA dehydrogenase